MEIIRNGKIIVDFGFDTLYFDCGKNILKGSIFGTMFPEFIRDKYKDIISRSFNGYQDGTTIINGYFSHNDYNKNNSYNISFTFNNKINIYTTEIKIPLLCFAKQRIDFLEGEVNRLNNKIDFLTSLITQIIDKNNNIIDLTNSDQEEQSNKRKRKYKMI